MVQAGWRLKHFERYSKIFIGLYALNVFVVFLLFLVLFIDIEVIEDSFEIVVITILGLTVCVTQVALFIMFQFLQVYFYRMGLRYIKILRDDNEQIGVKKSKFLFGLIILVIFISSFHMLLVFVYFFISRTYKIKAQNDD